jgi:hypothetical protein
MEKEYSRDWIVVSSEIGENHFEKLLVNNQSVITEVTQICDTLIRYKHRPNSVRKSLFRLLNYSKNYCDPEYKLIELVIIMMREYPKSNDIQAAACSFLSAFTSIPIENTDIKLHNKAIGATLKAMELFPKDEGLQRVSLITLANCVKLRAATFDRFKCVLLVMDSLVNFNENIMNRYAVWICSILSPQLSTVEKSNLGSNHVYMETLLQIVRNHVHSSSNNEFIFESILSLLWTLTDLSPKSCEMFLEKSGLDLYLDVLKVRYSIFISIFNNFFSSVYFIIFKQNS